MQEERQKDRKTLGQTNRQKRGKTDKDSEKQEYRQGKKTDKQIGK